MSSDTLTPVNQASEFTFASTGFPLLDAELQSVPPAVQQLGKSIINLADRYDIALDGNLPLLKQAYGDATDRHLVRTWSADFRAFGRQSNLQFPRLPELLNALARVEFHLGEFQSAQKDFQALSSIAPTIESQAQARYNAFRACLERPNYVDAIVELRQAVVLEPMKYTPVHLDRFDPERIMGADSTGLALKCFRRDSLTKGEPILVRTLYPDTIDRDITELFNDYKTLSKVRNRSLLPILGTGYALSNNERPFFTSPFFEASPLDVYVQRSGVLTPKDAVALLVQFVDALMAMHEAGVYHRALRPEHILVRRKVSGFSGVLINPGINLSKELMQTPVDNPAMLTRTLFGRSLANILDYASPEQLGKFDAPVGPATDVFSFAKCACLMIFGTPHPALQHWKQAGENLADLLHRSLAQNPADRPTLSEIKEKFDTMIATSGQKPQKIDPTRAALIASYQAPPQGVGAVTVPLVPAGMAIRRRLSTSEIAWKWRFTILKWTGLVGLVLIFGIMLGILFWPSGGKATGDRASNVPVPARGKIQIQDKPLANAKITFRPEAQNMPSAFATSDENGNFVLTTRITNDGAVPGRYVVLVTKESDPNHRKVVPPLPLEDPRFKALYDMSANMDSEVNPIYGILQRSELRETIAPNGSTELLIVLNYTGSHK